MNKKNKLILMVFMIFITGLVFFFFVPKKEVFIVPEKEEHEISLNDFYKNIEEKSEASTANKQEFKLEKTYNIYGEKSKISFEFKKIIDSGKDGLEIMKEYNSAYLENVEYPQAPISEGLEYWIYEMKVEYSNSNVKKEFPVLIQTDEKNESGGILEINGTSWVNRPFVLSVKEEDDSMIYTIASMKDKNMDKICYIYTFLEETGNEPYLFCLK